MTGGVCGGFYGVDSWRVQYFQNQHVPDGVVIPIDDATAWELWPAHRWVYNKLLICETQGLPHGPHGTMPPSYPVFSKPIYNLRGMGTGGRAIGNEAAYLANLTPGYLWMPNLRGTHVSTDIALARGRAVWSRQTTGIDGPGGTFDYWAIRAAADPVLEQRLLAWTDAHLPGFSGIVNFETIGGRIIECHLRMAEQWIDLNGEGWLEAVVRLYATGEWQFADRPRDGYSVVLFGVHGVRWSIDRTKAEHVLERADISSLQITFDDDVVPEQHAMPPGGFRLAIINCWDLDAGFAAREALRSMFVPREAATAPLSRQASR